MKNQKMIAAGIAGALGAAAGVLAVRTYQRYRRDTSAATQRLLSGSTVAQTSMGPVEYAVEGSGSPVLVIHGAGGGYDQGLLMARFINNTFQAISVSRFGYLRTPLPEQAGLDSQADALAALLDELGVEKCAAVGISAGGPSALYFALRHPERCSALMLLCAVSQPMPLPYDLNMDKIKLLLHFEFAGWLLTHPLRPVLLSMAGVPPEVYKNLTQEERQTVDELVRSILPIAPKLDGILNDCRQILGMEDIPLEEIQTPTLLIHVANDPLVPVTGAQQTARRLPNARLVELPFGGHLLVGNHRTIIPEVEAFLKENQAGNLQE